MDLLTISSKQGACLSVGSFIAPTKGSFIAPTTLLRRRTRRCTTPRFPSGPRALPNPRSRTTRHAQPGPIAPPLAEIKGGPPADPRDPPGTTPQTILSRFFNTPTLDLVPALVHRLPTPSPRLPAFHFDKLRPSQASTFAQFRAAQWASKSSSPPPPGAGGGQSSHGGSLWAQQVGQVHCTLPSQRHPRKYLALPE